MPKQGRDSQHSIHQGVVNCSNAAKAVIDSLEKDTGQDSSSGGASQDSCSRKNEATGDHVEMMTTQLTLVG
jgi:hypothetical protein